LKKFDKVKVWHGETSCLSWTLALRFASQSELAVGTPPEKFLELEA
jgi:hypothetical protein